MTSPTGHSGRPRPLVVLASREGTALQELETALYSAGYRVVTARTEHDTLQKVHNHQPDAVVVDRDVSEQGYAICRSIRNDPSVSAASPIMMTQDAEPTIDERRVAWRSGAWALDGNPTDVEELLLRLGVFLHAKVEADRLLEECLVDRGTGLYNTNGFSQRVHELAALTTRQGVPSACAVFRTVEPLPSRAIGDRIGRAFKTRGRLSDALGRTAASEFAIFAPATNDWAASRLVRRMRDNVTQEIGYVSEYGKRLELKAAYSATLPSHKVELKVLLERARTALS